MMTVKGYSFVRSLATFAILPGFLFAGSQGFHGRYPAPFGANLHPHYTGYGHDDVYRSSYRRQPCPVYQGMEVSQWAQHANNNLAAYVALPGIRANHRQASLDESGTAINIRAFRALTAGRACLPRTAEISKDGTAEVFDAVLNVPVGWDASRARVRDVRGGLQIFVPPTKAVQYLRRHAVVPDLPSHKTAHYTAGQEIGAAESRETQQPETHTTDLAERNAWLLDLPSSHGIEVVEEEFPASVKSSDAAEGFWDNRGDFQYY